MNMDPWDFENGGQLTREEAARQEKQSRTGYTTRKATSHFFVDDIDHPYNETKRFDWMRGYHVGGRSIMWGKHSYRLSETDFTANLKDGVGVDWPIRYKDLAPWYSHVEKFIGVSGENLGLEQLPDGEFLPVMDMNCAEDHLKKSIAKNYKDRVLTMGRVAHITEGTKPGLGRSKCQYRNRCSRGCRYGAYFSSNSSTLPTAEATGNMTLRPNSVVHEVMYDKNTQKATGVRVIDALTTLGSSLGQSSSSSMWSRYSSTSTRSSSEAVMRPRTEMPAECTVSRLPETSGCQSARSLPSATSR